MAYLRYSRNLRDAIFLHLDSTKNCVPSPPTFSNIFQLSYFVLIISQHTNGCFLFCLNLKQSDLTFINKFLTVIFVLFKCSKLDIQSSGLGMILRFDLLLKCFGIW